MDNAQFRFGQALRPVGNAFGNLLDVLKKTYLMRIHGFRLESICVMTIIFEGNYIQVIRFRSYTLYYYFIVCSIFTGKQSEVVPHKDRIIKIAQSFDGVIAGEKNGERGYMLTFVIAYIRVRNSLVLM